MVEKTLFTMAPNKINHSGISLTRYRIVRLETPHAALISLSLTGSQRLLAIVLLLLSDMPTSPWERSPVFIQASQSHFPAGTRGLITLLVPQCLPPTASAGSLGSWVQPLGSHTARDVLLGCEHVWLTHCCPFHESSVGAVCSAVAHYLGWGKPSLRWNR